MKTDEELTAAGRGAASVVSLACAAATWARVIGSAVLSTGEVCSGRGGGGGWWTGSSSTAGGPSFASSFFRRSCKHGTCFKTQGYNSYNSCWVQS